MEVDRHGLSVLDDDACCELLASARMGRLALTNGALPIILPVTFGRIDKDLVFQVGPGVLARAAAAEHVVCFQADWAGHDLESLWSVSVIGKLSVVTAPEQLRRAIQLDLGPWSTPNGRYIRLEPQLFSGRSRS